ncbi:hypothetical protein D9M68_805950 [compost metagenome]
MESLITQDTGVVDQHIDAAEDVEGVLNDFLAIGHRIMVGHSSTTGGADFLDHSIRSRGIGAFAMGAAAKVVHHHLGAMLGEQQSVGAAEATTSTGDDHDLVLKTDGFAHAMAPRQVGKALSVQQVRDGHNQDARR